MKKIIPFFLISLLLFSCASTPEETASESIANQLSETENNVESENSTENATSESEDAISTDENDSNKENTDSTIPSINVDEIAEIEEPLVLELEPQPEPQDENNEDSDISTEDMAVLEEIDELVLPDSFDDDEYNLENSDEQVLADNTLDFEETELNATENDINTFDNSLISPEEDTNISENTVQPEDDNLTSEQEQEEKETEAEQTEKNTLIPEENAEEPQNEELTEIEETEEIEENTEQIAQEPVPSRSVTIKKGEYLDVVYPGLGWVYEGPLDNSRDITYNGKKLGSANTTFTLIGRKEGTKLVRFFKKDVLTDKLIDDYLEITVTSEKASNKIHKIAPDYAEIVPSKPVSVSESQKNESTSSENEAEIISEKKSDETLQKQDSSFKTEKQNPFKTDSAKTAENTAKNDNNTYSANIDFINNDFSEENDSQEFEQEQNYQDDIIDLTEENSVNNTNINTAKLLEKAKSLYDEKSFEEALETIELYLSTEAHETDEGLFLKGQILEAWSGIQNIKKAVQTYTLLMDSYPYSIYWDKAYKRVTYLKRFYLEVR